MRYAVCLTRLVSFSSLLVVMLAAPLTVASAADTWRQLYPQAAPCRQRCPSPRRGGRSNACG